MCEEAYFSGQLPAMGFVDLFSFNNIIHENVYIIVVTIPLINRKFEHLQLLQAIIIIFSLFVEFLTVYFHLFHSKMVLGKISMVQFSI